MAGLRFNDSPSQLSLLHQIFMYGLGRVPTGAHGQDHGGGAGDDIAAGIDSFARGLACLRVGDDIPPFGQFQVGNMTLGGRC